MTMRRKQTPISKISSLISDSDTTAQMAKVTRAMFIGEVYSVFQEDGEFKLKVFIPKIDAALTTNRDNLPVVRMLPPTNIQNLPLPGESVVVFLENPWEPDKGRWWLGPIIAPDGLAFPLDSVVIRGRGDNSVVLDSSGNIDLVSGESDEPGEPAATRLTLDKFDESVILRARDILLSSTVFREDGTQYSSVYGERLIEILRFILETMMSHSHPPNSPPTPDFFVDANRYLSILDDWLVNKNVRLSGV